ncbi:hypothetical protein O5O45_12575 [Hahella aquimaris]|uniref:hypothetical protein n=1 Tax=Hahella sp. HNIBRBA332 TaxID=3015983 RepID=UPI00273B6695|nr:hypothetical protein [Hahella sp. HNIBRBA332]WLQ16753.1 hypothetical protein O5O45_12575 [Hahella sp. HNIBRBA332]
MNIDKALEFLRKHQPLPADEDVSEADIDMLNQVRELLISNPDERAIPLVLNAFGDGGGFGVYQVCDDIFRPFKPEAVLPHLKNALASKHYGVRYWASQWAMEINSIDIAPEINSMLKNPEDTDAHYYCVAALIDIWGKTKNPFVSKSIIELGGKSKNIDVSGLIHEHRTEK